MAGANKADENRRLQEELTSLKFTVEKVSSRLFLIRSAGSMSPADNHTVLNDVLQDFLFALCQDSVPRQ